MSDGEDNFSKVSSWSPPTPSQERQCDTSDFSALFITVQKFLRTKLHLRESREESDKKWQANLDEVSCLMKGAFVAVHSVV